MKLSKRYSFAKFRVFSAAIIGVAFGLSGWAASTGIVLAQDFTVINPVKLVPQEIEGTFKLKVDKDNQCRKEKHPGCLLFKRGEAGYIVFHLPGSKNQVKNCSSAKNVITKIEVTATGADNGTSVYKGDFGAIVPAWLVDAFPGINPESGIIYEADWDVARTQEWVSNLNNHVNQPDEGDVIKSFWYRVTVTACAENKEGEHTMWVSDPRGDNEGNH